MNNKFITDLKKELEGPLPGLAAHSKLFPEYRKSINYDEKKTDAGVLLLLFPDDSGKLTLPLIKRPPNTGPHSNQVSFPGGKYEKYDQNLASTALRETSEEIGTDDSKIMTVGKLTELYIPVSKYLVHPYIGYTTITPSFKLDQKEVEYLITIHIEDLIRLPIKNKTMVFDNVSYQIPYYDIKSEVVWGATSMILCEFIEIIKKTL